MFSSKKSIWFVDVALSNFWTKIKRAKSPYFNLSYRPLEDILYIAFREIRQQI